MTVDVVVPDNPPTLTPGAARALLTIYLKADERRRAAEDRDEGKAAA